MHDFTAPEENVKVEFGYYRTLLILIALISVFGISMLLSASTAFSIKYYGSSTFIFKKQLIFLVAGFIIMLFVSRIDYNFYRQIAYPLYIFGLILLILTYVPHISHKVKGAHRWINLGLIKLQPSEFVKIFVIILLAYLIEKKQDIINNFSKGFLPFIVIPGISMLLILKQPDFGTFLIIGLVVFIMIFIAGTRISYIISVILIALPAIYLLIMSTPYRKMRFLAFLDPWKLYKTFGFQIAQSLISFGSGGFWGCGIGNSVQKLFYLPEAHTDYIFAIIAEELGFPGVIAVIGLFFALFYTCLKISLKVENIFGKLMGLGFSFLIIIEVLINTGMCMGILPPKGIALPFFSYGGSALLAKFFMFGIMLNLAKKVDNG